MRTDLLKLIPEFDLIQDKDLREKTLQCWEEGMRLGGWKPEDLRRMPFTLLYDPCPASMLEHTRGNVLVCVGAHDALKQVYAGDLKIDRDILLAGAILHDVGKLLEMEEKDGKFVKSRSGKLLRHPVSGACLAARFGLPEPILHIIANHSKEGDGMRRTNEGVLLHHADFTNFEIFAKG